MIPFIVHSKCILAGRSFVAYVTIVPLMLDVLGLDVLGDVTLNSGAIVTLTAVPHTT